MPTLIVPIQVKIGLRPNGHADHPAWEQVPLIAAGLPASPSLERIDEEVRKHVVGGWHYDKTSGHQADTPDSPRGMQWGMLLVSRAFADGALATFPALITVLTQTACQAFWDDKAMIRLSDEDHDLEALQGLQTRRALMVARGAPAPALAAVDAKIDRALDPDDPSPGVRKNPLRRFATAKVVIGVDFHPSVVP